MPLVRSHPCAGGFLRTKVYDVVAPVLDAGDVRREGVHAGRDDRADAVHGMEDRGCQADARLGVGVHDRGAGVSTIYITEPRCLVFGECITARPVISISSDSGLV